MKVDLTTIIISIFALLTFIVPIVWDQISQKKTTKKLTTGLTQAAQKENIDITEHDIWGVCYAIGIDKNSKKLLYVKKEKNQDQVILINLSDVESCKVVNDKRSVKSRRDNGSVTENIGLLFIYKETNKPGNTLEFYNGENGKLLTGELSLAYKWNKTIKSIMKADK